LRIGLKRLRSAEKDEDSLPAAQNEKPALAPFVNMPSAELSTESLGDRWIGYVDSIERTVITGWCCDKDHLDRHVVVEALASNGKSKRTLAAIFREDVKEAGFGDGKYGFELDVASLGLKEETIIVRFAESKVVITNAPFSLDPQRSVLDGRLPSSFTNAMQLLALEVRAKHDELRGSTELTRS